MAQSRLQAKLIMCNVPTSNSAGARKFYNALLGGDDFVRNLNDKIESYSRPISPDGIDLTISPRVDDREGLMCYFGVADLQAAIETLKKLGGTVVVQPLDVNVSGSPKALEFYRRQNERRGEAVASNKVGRMAIMLDPDGNYVGLMQLEESAKRYFRVGKFYQPLQRDQVEQLDQAKLATNLFLSAGEE